LTRVGFITTWLDLGLGRLNLI